MEEFLRKRGFEEVERLKEEKVNKTDLFFIHFLCGYCFHQCCLAGWAVTQAFRQVGC